MQGPSLLDTEFLDAHERATRWMLLDHPEMILQDEKIPKALRLRVHAFVTGEGVSEHQSLPATPSEFWFRDTDQGSNFRNYLALLEQKKWPQRAIESIESSTRTIMNFLFDPTGNDSASEERHGLVVGRVQSGKTANYAGLIARAADAGYTMVVVMAGLHNNLRRQTQQRLDEELCTPASSSPVERRLVPFTNPERDYQSVAHATHLTASEGRCNLFVIKKNVSPLKKLHEQLSKLSELERWSHRLLIVDDEADHATINTKPASEPNPDLPVGLEDEMDDEEDQDAEISDVTKINSYIRMILGLFKQRAYVGYTATPFANVLIDPDSVHPALGKTLYPRDFIIALPKPQGYIGLEEFFPSPDAEEELEHHLVHVIDREEALLLRELDASTEPEKSTDVPPALQRAMMDFYLSGAVRTLREPQHFHHSMLVHSKHTKSNQAPIFDRISSLVELWKTQLLHAYSAAGRALRTAFLERWDTTFAPHLHTNHDWNLVLEALLDFVREGVQTRLVNSDSSDELDYDAHPEGLHVIAVGGNRLSRGLTLEGLACTYFIRETKMYDTLTQMGRWFGYRPRYDDLVRLHTTGLLVEWFSWLAGVERALLSDIDRYQSDPEGPRRTPKDLAVRILKHHAMLPTSRNKMRSARLLTNGLSASTPRTVRFRFDREDILTANLAAAAALVGELNPDDAESLPSTGTLLWRDVDPDYILSLVQGYQTHPEELVFDKEQVETYIKRKVNDEELSSWSVALLSSSTGRKTTPFEPWGIDVTIGLPTRTRIRGTDNIGELIQASHVVVDLPGPTSRYMRRGHVSYPLMYKHRSPTNPLLLLYVLDPLHAPESDGGSRVPLFEEGSMSPPVVGLAMALPASSAEADPSLIPEYWAVQGVSHE